MYNKGETMIQKIGPIGESGEGIGNPTSVSDPPKSGSEQVIGISNDIDDGSHRKKKI